MPTARIPFFAKFILLLIFVSAQNVYGQTRNIDDYTDHYRQFHMSAAKINSGWTVLQCEENPVEGAEQTLQSLEKVAKKLPPSIRKTMLKGLELRYRHKYMEAVHTYESILTERPDYWPAQLERADALSYAKRYQDAVDAATLVLKMQPSNWYALTLRAYCFGVLKEYRKAISDSTKAISLRPDDSKGYRNRAQSEKFLNLSVQAAEDERKAQKIETLLLSRSLVASGKLTQALEQLNQYVSENPKEAVGYDHRAYLNLCLGKYNQVVEDCDTLIGLAPDLTPHACSIRAKAYDSLGQYQKAANDYTVAIDYCRTLTTLPPATKKKISPSLSTMSVFLPQYLKQRAYAYIHLKRFTEALEDCRQLISINKSESSYYSLRGEVYAASGQNHEAVQDYKIAMRLKPSKYLASQIEELDRELAHHKP